MSWLGPGWSPPCFRAKFLPLVEGLPDGATRVLVGPAGASRGRPRFEQLLAGGRRSAPTRRRQSRQILLTSGTTGMPKEAHRGRSAGLDALVPLLSVVPMRTGEVTHIAAPMFHAWGLAHLAIGGVMGSTLVLRRGSTRNRRCDSSRTSG